MAQFAPQYNLMGIIDKLRISIDYTFWLVFALSIIPAIFAILNIKFNVDDLLNTLNMISISLFFILDIIVENILIPQADSKRRDDFIDNSFGSTFSPNPSIGYFDNDSVLPGIYKAAVNLFENNFFTYSLVKAVTLRKIIMPTIVLLSIVVIAYYGFKQVPFGLSLLQTLFSANLLGALVKHCVLMVRLQFIYETWVSLFQHNDFKSDTKKYEAQIYRQWLQYETLHSRIQAGVPNSIFEKLNSKLTQDWITIKTRYKIN